MYLAPPTSLNKFRFLLSWFDCLWIVLSPFIALGLRGSSLLYAGDLPFNPSITFVYAFLTIIITFAIFIMFRVGEGLSHYFSMRDAILVFNASVMSVIVSIFITFSFTRLDGIPRPVPFIQGIVLAFGILFYRVTLRSFYENKLLLSSINNKGFDVLPSKTIILIGLDSFSISAIRLIKNQVPQTIRILCCFSLLEKYTGKTISNIHIYADLSKLESIIDEYQIHGIKVNEIWISDSFMRYDDSLVKSAKLEANTRGIEFKTISDAMNLKPLDKDDLRYSSLDVLRNSDFELIKVPPASFYVKFKRLAEIIVSSVLLLILLPFIATIILITIFDIGYPALFWQERVGWYGKSFRFYKIRSMRLSPSLSGSVISSFDIITKFGIFIRHYRIDELPQLISVIVGDMSIIGPRPLLFIDQPQGKKVRLIIRPGITGWAQVNGAQLLSIDEKNALDCWYVYNMSFSVDLRILFQTLILLFFGVKRNQIAIDEAMKWMEYQKYF